jgi:hypothetical protein
LKKDDPAETDLQDAQKSIAAAVGSLDNINLPSPDFGKALFQRVQDMKGAMPAAGAKPTFDRVTAAVPTPGAVIKAVPAAPPAEVVPASYASVDIAVRKMQILVDYAIFAEGTTDPNTKQRLKERENKLVSYLNVESWEALQAARLLLQEMKDDVYPERLSVALTAIPIDASIEMEPATAYEEEPLEFRIRFADHFVDTSSARQELACTWNFGDGLQAQGWVVSHYFLLPRRRLLRRREAHTFGVSATFQDPAGKPITLPGKSEPVRVERKVTVLPSRLRDWIGERTVAEVARLSVALLVAVFALVAGVKDQLAKLDVLPGLISIFAAGYGVDVLKNLINSGKNS